MDKIRPTVKENDILKNCKVIDKNEYHYFLEDGEYEQTFYDIVMPKEYVTNDIKIGDILNVSVMSIEIADDGQPGIFVKHC